MGDTASQVVAEPFRELLGRIEAEAAEGLFHTAAQLVVDLRGERVLDAAVGRTHLHEPFRTDTLSALYCTAKPLVAVAVLVLVEDGELSMDDRLRDVVPGLDTPWIADRTVEEVRLYFTDPAALGADHATARAALLRDWMAVFDEDVAVVEGMQAGRASPAFDGGAFSPVHDPPVHHFHRWVARRMGPV